MFQAFETPVVLIGETGKLLQPRRYMPLMEHPSEKGDLYETTSSKL